MLRARSPEVRNGTATGTGPPAVRGPASRCGRRRRARRPLAAGLQAQARPDARALTLTVRLYLNLFYYYIELRRALHEPKLARPALRYSGRTRARHPGGRAGMSDRQLLHTLAIEWSAPVAYVRFNRPERHNTVTSEMADEMYAALLDLSG